MTDGRTWQILSDLPAWQVTEIPRRPETQDGQGAIHHDLGAAQRMQALVSAFHRGLPVAMGWVRMEAGGPVRVLAAGPAVVGGSDSGQVVLSLPTGGRGYPLQAGQAAAAMDGMPCWMRLAGVTDVLLADRDEPGLTGRDPRDERPSLEDGLLSAWLGPFAWLVLAEPVNGAVLEELTSTFSLAQLNAQQSDSPRSKLAARRAAARHAELRQAATTGLWHIHLAAGGPTPEAAAQIAGLLCASADLDGLPYALVPVAEHGPLPVLLDAADGRHDGRAATFPRRGPGTWEATGSSGPRAAYPTPTAAAPGAIAGRRGADDPVSPVAEYPFYGSSRLLAAMARAPAREVPGIRFALRPDFDVSPETGLPRNGVPAETSGEITAGTVLDWNRIPAGTLTVPLASLNRHTFVCGATGAGKSQTVRGLLEQATQAGVPWLVIEPAKAEYQLMAARLPSTTVIRVRPGDLDQPAAGINPLEPAPGPEGTRFPLQTHADLVRALFLAAFDADEPFPQVLAAALTRCYEQAGWDLITGQPADPQLQPGYPSLEDLQAAAITVVEEIGYGREVADNVRGFVQVRLGSLRLGTTGRFLDGGHPIDFATLLDGNVVFEIEDAGDDRDKAFLMGTVLIRLIEHLRLRQRAERPASPRLRHLTVIEEAHRLLRQSPSGATPGAAAHAVEMFAGLLAEIRAYGEGLIIAEQIPAKLIPDVIKNTAVKIVHRLPAADDRQTVGATMNLTSQQSQYLVTLIPGEAAVFTDGMDYPILARMPDGAIRETNGRAATMSPSGIIGRRSLTCGPDCAAAPCTLRQMRAAQLAARTDPRITLWAELAVLGHLTGWGIPALGATFATALTATAPRLRDCALSHAVDTAVAARISAIAARVSGPALAAHVTTAMRHGIADGSWQSCRLEEPEYLAPPYEWTAVLDDLRETCENDPAAGRHPSSDAWEVDYHRPIPGTTCADQLQAVRHWDQSAKRDQRLVHAVLYGTRQPSAIEKAVAARNHDLDWPKRLADALSAFHDCQWPIALLPGSSDRA
ncbi:MAG: ATP-binding protein [Streptosporangiaceae bacterium]|nr:ATP-binding protein [Streptosporangiaceae bacterium]